MCSTLRKFWKRLIVNWHFLRKFLHIKLKKFFRVVSHRFRQLKFKRNWKTCLDNLKWCSTKNSMNSNILKRESLKKFRRRIRIVQWLKKKSRIHSITMNKSLASVKKSRKQLCVIWWATCASLLSFQIKLIDINHSKKCPTKTPSPRLLWCEKTSLKADNLLPTRSRRLFRKAFQILFSLKLVSVLVKKSMESIRPHRPLLFLVRTKWVNCIHPRRVSGTKKIWVVTTRAFSTNTKVLTMAGKMENTDWGFYSLLT